MSGNRNFFLLLAVATLGLGGVAGLRADDAKPAAATPAAAMAQEQDAGERIMNGSCQGCHDLRTIQTAAKDANGWATTIDTMIVNGATIAKEDIPVLVKYLTFRHGPMPDGPGKAQVLTICTMCHDLGRVKFGRRSAEEWEETLISMLNEGAPLSDQDFPVVHEYLSQSYGVD
jgi:cytochrome c5